MALLDLIQGAAVRCGFSAIPTSAVSNTDANVMQLVAFAQDAGQELFERANWVNLDTAGSVTGDGASTLFSLPLDWVRFSPGDKSPKGALVSSLFPLVPLYGPVNTEDLNLLKALPVGSLRPVWRIIGGVIEIWPALASGDIVTFNYYSSYWIRNAAATSTYGAWASDTDVSLINQDTIMKGVVWRWQQSKGLDYAETFRAYEMSFSRNAAQQMTERVISTSSSISGGDVFYGTITDLTDSAY